MAYPQAQRLLVLGDGGGSNSATQYLFKEDLQGLANQLGLEVRVAHYPPYCSKHNPIEHQVFPHITRACQGVIFHTVDIAQHFFSTDKADFAILDAPGHRDFVPNMIGGAAMADLGVLVVDANQLESGLRGQTKEHVLLARAVGLERMIVAVNKMDGTTPEWNQGVFEEVSGEVRKLLLATGFEEEKIKVVPCSGLSGDNVAKAGKAAWAAESCGTLTSALESMAATVHTSDEAVKGPLRMQITDIFRGGVQNPFSVSGRIASGNVQAGDSVQVQPRGEQTTVKSIEIANEPRDYAVAGPEYISGSRCDWTRKAERESLPAAPRNVVLWCLFVVGIKSKVRKDEDNI